MTTPVRPMPPAVAQNRAGSDEADRVTVPVGVTSVISRTWEQKLPSTWWFLPWMSAAMAPPTVTSRVPGVTGTNQPSGTRRSIRVCRLTPAPTVTWPDVQVDPVDGVQPGGVEDRIRRRSGPRRHSSARGPGR